MSLPAPLRRYRVILQDRHGTSASLCVTAQAEAEARELALRAFARARDWQGVEWVRVDASPVLGR